MQNRKGGILAAVVGTAYKLTCPAASQALLLNSGMVLQQLIAMWAVMAAAAAAAVPMTLVKQGTVSLVVGRAGVVC